MAGKLLQAERPQQALPPPRPVPGDVVPEPHHRRRSVCREHHRHRNHGQHPGVAVPQRRALRPRIFHPFDMPLGFLDQALHHRRRSFLLSSFKAGFPYQTVTMSYAMAVAMRRGDLTDQQWQWLEPLLPPEKPWTGRPNEDHRQILNGILWIHRTGAPWRDLPRRYGPVGTVSSRFYRWRKAGIWQRILSDLQAEANQRGEIDWDLHFVDATIVRAHQHAGGARRDGATPEEAQAREALGRSQGGFSTKLHLRAEGNGRPITVVLTGGERNAQIALEAVLDQGAVRRPGRGRPRLRPRAAACDKAYSSPPARARMRRRHIRPVTPTRKAQPRQRNFDRAAYRLRNRVERLINRLKQARRVATLYEKRGENYLAMVHIGMILLWLKPFADTA